MDMSSLNGVIKLFEYYKLLGERTFEQVSDRDLFWQQTDESNSIAIIVNHLSGNMRSRWTDFISSDGEKSWRDRDQEFEDIIQSRDDLLNVWNTGWDCLFNALESINESNIDTKVTIRNQLHTIPEAINRQMMHYAYHIGQIVYIGKIVTGKRWVSLSVPKGKSAEFNAMKKEKGIHSGHFTDDLRK